MEKFWKYKLDHILFWTITVGFHIYTKWNLVAIAGWFHFFLEVVIRNGLLAVIIYAHIDYLIPLFIQQKKYAAYIATLIACFAFYVFAKNTHDVFLAAFASKPSFPFWTNTFYNFSIAVFYMSFSLALQLSKEWYFQRDRLRRMEVEKLNTELEYLKSQINPHFLFNSLNTIFFQIDKTNTDARNTLTKFSEMLRFQLYECNGREIYLEKEIHYLKNYVDLQRLRRDEKYKIEFTTAGHWTEFAIAPLLLMPLVENAFKYVSHFPEGNNKVLIHIWSDNKSLDMKVMNTRETRIAGRNEAGGIGLKNIRRRLELQYPGKHQLEINETKSEFEIRLRLSEI